MAAKKEEQSEPARKVAIITDSQACLTRELVEQSGIGIVPSKIRALIRVRLG